MSFSTPTPDYVNYRRPIGVPHTIHMQDESEIVIRLRISTHQICNELNRHKYSLRGIQGSVYFGIACEVLSPRLVARR
jgi:hypothetical protein